jgi:DNA topoisomerase-1
VIVNDIDDLDSKYQNYPRTAYEKKVKAKKGAAAKKTKTKRAPRKLAPSPLSSELSAILGVSELPRNQVMKKVWEHIKAQSLQDSDNKRIIKPDALLAAVLGSEEPIDMFKMTGKINKHILKPDTKE